MFVYLGLSQSWFVLKPTTYFHLQIVCEGWQCISIWSRGHFTINLWCKQTLDLCKKRILHDLIYWVCWRFFENSNHSRLHSLCSSIYLDISESSGFSPVEHWFVRIGRRYVLLCLFRKVYEFCIVYVVTKSHSSLLEWRFQIIGRPNITNFRLIDDNFLFWCTFRARIRFIWWSNWVIWPYYGASIVLKRVSKCTLVYWLCLYWGWCCCGSSFRCFLVRNWLRLLFVKQPFHSVIIRRGRIFTPFKNFLRRLISCCFGEYCSLLA